MPLRVALRKTSLVDFPGRVAAVFFFSGCNLRCPWCHNRGLVLGEEDDLVSIEEALAFVEKRRSVLSGVVFSGGEPLLVPELPEIAARVKRTDLKLKIDTNGTRPEALERLIDDPSARPDYVAMDLKVAPHRYAALSAGAQAGAAPVDVAADYRLVAALERSARAIAALPHEFRSLALPKTAFDESDVAALAPLVDDAPWYFSPFRPGNCLDPSWDEFPPTGPAEARRLAEVARGLGKRGEVRGA